MEPAKRMTRGQAGRCDEGGGDEEYEETDITHMRNEGRRREPKEDPRVQNSVTGFSSVGHRHILTTSTRVWPHVKLEEDVL